ncbi:MAG TPA: peroxide stress protein YaaA [Mycobacteriales bacterium]
MLVLLPPSETKAAGGDGPPLDLGALGHPELTPVRRTLADALVRSSADPRAARTALGLSERQQDLIEANAALWDAPTLPALRRYTGVLYDALGYATLPRAARARADAVLAVASALFGLLRATDPVPAYRLSGGTVLPGVGPLPALWRPVLGPVLAAAEGPVLDFRSGAYAALAPLPGAITVRVLTERADGTRTVVSHFSKHHKGLLIRALVSSRAAIGDLPAVLRVMRRAGYRVEETGARSLDLITAG